MFEAFGALEHLNHFTFFFLMNFEKKKEDLELNLTIKNVNTIKNHLLFNNSFDLKKWFVLLVAWFECVTGLKQCMLMSWIV